MTQSSAVPRVSRRAALRTWIAGAAPLMLLAAWALSSPIARSTWLGRPDPLAQAEPAEKAMSRNSDMRRATSSPWRRMLRLPA